MIRLIEFDLIQTLLCDAKWMLESAGYERFQKPTETHRNQTILTPPDPTHPENE